MANVSDIIILGTYPQEDGDFSKREPLEWMVLDKKDGRLLCVSRYLLECRPYHGKLEDTAWAECSLRGWLNQDFFRQAFSEEEQRRILPTDLINDEYGEYPQYNTTDRIFLLGCEEAERYFEFEERAAKTTAYARAQGAWFLKEEEAEPDGSDLNTGLWWLRYPDVMWKEKAGRYDTLSVVNFDGYIEHYADDVTGANICVRPAMWIKA